MWNAFFILVCFVFVCLFFFLIMWNVVFLFAFLIRQIFLLFVWKFKKKSSSEQVKNLQKNNAMKSQFQKKCAQSSEKNLFFYVA